MTEVGTFPGSLFPEWVCPPAAPRVRGGYGGIPGTGPKGETCKSCYYRVRNVSGSGRVFQKCGLIRWTHGAATDIRVKSPSCSKWKKLDG